MADPHNTMGSSRGTNCSVQSPQPFLYSDTQVRYSGDVFCPLVREDRRGASSWVASHSEMKGGKGKLYFSATTLGISGVTKVIRDRGQSTLVSMDLWHQVIR